MGGTLGPPACVPRASSISVGLAWYIRRRVQSTHDTLCVAYGTRLETTTTRSCTIAHDLDCQKAAVVMQRPDLAARTLIPSVVRDK